MAEEEATRIAVVLLELDIATTMFLKEDRTGDTGREQGL